MNSPGLREPRAQLDAAREQQAQHGRAAVPVQLEHVLAGVGMRRRKVEREPLVERLAARVAERREGGHARRERLRATSAAAMAGTPAPDTRTTPMPPRPGGVAIAAIVSGDGVIDLGATSHGRGRCSGDAVPAFARAGLGSAPLGGGERRLALEHPVHVPLLEDLAACC